MIKYDKYVKIVKSTFLFIFSDPEVLFPLCFECYEPEIMFDEDDMNMGFHGNQIQDIVAILLLKTFY